MKPTPVRPVGARPLKSARDTLRPYFPDATVLDLFAGHGRFGVAALEEGAKTTVFVEQDRKRLKDLSGKLAKQNGAHFFAMDVFAFLQKEAKQFAPYDVVFADPPFPLWVPPFAEKLTESLSHLVTPGAILLVKHPSRVIPSLQDFGWKKWRDSRFGESSFSYLTHESTHEPGG